jgi:hypothetical protein
MAVDELGPRPAEQTSPYTFGEISGLIADATLAQLDELRWHAITHHDTEKVGRLVEMYAARRRYLNNEARIARAAAERAAALAAPEGPSC